MILNKISNKMLSSQVEMPLISAPDEVVTCQNCENELIPHRIYDPSSLSWLIGGGYCIIGCWFGLCLIPLCSRYFQVATVQCSYCHKVINSAEYY